MKQFFKQSAAICVAALMLLLALFAINYTPTADAQAQVGRGLPVYWYDSTGSNGFGLNASAVPNLTAGGLKYTGTSTNLSVVGATRTNTVVIVNGIITAIQ